MRTAAALASAVVLSLWLGVAVAQVEAFAARVPLAEAGARLPLASAGTVLRWAPDVDEVFFDLPDASWVRLAVYSPSIDLDEVGDERYDDRPLEAVFELTGVEGESLAHDRFTLVPSGWTTLYEGMARPGRHVLHSQVLGHGKNVYLLRLETESGDVALHGEQVTVNVSRRDWHPAFTFAIDRFARCELGLYDGDGDAELEAVLVLPSGDRVRPPVSADLAWTTQPLPRLLGPYTVWLRIPEGAYQGTNAVRFEVRCGGERVPVPLLPPQALVAPEPGEVVVEVVDLQGKPVDVAHRVEGRFDRVVTLDEDDRYQLVDTETRDGTTLGPRSVGFGPEGGFVRFVLDRVAEPVRLPVPEVRAVVPAPRPLPLPRPTVVSPPLPQPLPLPLPSPAAVPPPSPSPAEAPLPAPAELTLVRELAPAALLPCEVADVRLTVRNLGGLAAAYELDELLPAGLEPLGALLTDARAFAWAGTLDAGAAIPHAYRVRMEAGAAEALGLRAELAWDGRELGDAAAIERVLLDVAVSLEEDGRTLYPHDAFAVVARVRNPLDRPVTAYLTPTASSRLALIDGPVVLELPAGGHAEARFAVAGREPGAAAFQLLAYACDPAVGEVPPAAPASSLRLTLSPLPELPAPQLSTQVTIDLAARRLPVLDGLAVVSRLPAGARYLPGSSRVDGVSVADPRQVDGALVFELAGSAAARVDYTVLHEEAILTSDDDHALIARTPLPEVLVGDPRALETYLREPDELRPAPAPGRERVGTLILEPADGAVVRSGGSTHVTIDADLDHDVRLLVNGEPVSADRIGEHTRGGAPARQTLRFIGVPLRAGPNELRAEAEGEDAVAGDAVTVYLAGPPAAIRIEPASPLVADTVAPLRLDVFVSDAWGHAPRDSFVTVDVAGGAIASPDADPQQAGHQVAFRDGRGVLELAPFAGPGRFTLVAAVGLAATEARFEVVAEARPWLVNGVASLGAHLGDDVGVGVSGSVFARGSVFGDALLTLAAQAPLEPLGTGGEPFDRFPVTGSSDTPSADAESRHGVYARLERGEDYLQYGDFVASFDGGLQTPRSYTGLSGAWSDDGGLGIRAYAAVAPTRDLVTGLELPSDGTSAYRLPHAPVRPGTLRLEVVKRDRVDGRLLLDDGDPRLRTLVVAADYAVDEAVGAILLVRPLPLADAAGNPYLLRASYQVASLDDAPAFAQFGIQAGYEAGDLTLRAGVSQETRGEGEYERLASVGLAVDGGGWTGDLDVGFGSDETAGGLGVALGVRVGDGPLRAEADYRFLGVGYRGGGVVDDTQAGHAARLGVTYALDPAWSVAASGQLRSFTQADELEVGGRVAVAYQGRGDVVLADRVIATRPRAEAGVQADGAGIRALASVALRDLFGAVGSEARVTHLQGLGVSVPSVTDVGLAFRLADALELRLTDRILWGDGHTLLVGLQSGFEHAELARLACQSGIGPCEPGSALPLGRSTVHAQLEIPGGLSATAGSLRLGIDTRYPLSERWSVEGSAAQVVDLDDAARSATVLTTGLTYDGDELDAGLRYEARLTPDGTKHVGTASATGALGTATFASVQLRYLAEPDAASPQGGSFSVAFAHRGERVSLLAHHRGSFGSLQAAGEREFDGDTRVAWTVTPAWEVTAGHAYQWLADDGLVDQLSLGATWHAWDGGSVSGTARVLFDRATGQRSPGAGLEVAQALGCGLYGVVGYNAWDGLGADRGAVFGQAGAYVRLDVVFDENWRCGGGTDREDR